MDFFSDASKMDSALKKKKKIQKKEAIGGKKERAREQM